MHKLSLELEELLRTANPDGIRVGEFVDTMSERGFGFLLMALSLPSVFPIPAVGYSVPFVLLIIALALQMIAGRSSPVLPQRVCGKSISPKMVAFIKNRGVPFLRRVERFSNLRLEKLSERRLFRSLVGMLTLVFAVVMLIPVPGTNTIFGLTILIMGFGLVNRDGLFVLGGGMFGLMAVAVVIVSLIAGRLAFYHFVD